MTPMTTELLTFRIPISDGPDGRVGYMYFSEQPTDPPGGWRLSLKERDEFDAMTGPDRQSGIDALASALEGFGNSRLAVYHKMLVSLQNVPTSRPGFRGDYRARVLASENVRYNKSKQMLLTTCKQVGDRLRVFGWPVPGERRLTDGTLLVF